MEAVTISGLLGNVKTVMTSLLDMAKDVLGVITTNPLLLLFVSLGIIGYVIVTVRSLLKTN